jgi:hypothetical protein
VTTYQIIYGLLAEEELGATRVFDHRRILAAIEAGLQNEPLVPSRNRKRIEPTPPELIPEIEKYLPTAEVEVWQLRVGAWRVIYAVAALNVYVIRIIFKGRRTTRDAVS